MGWWSYHQEANWGICSKICRISDGLDWGSARWWIDFPSKIGLVEFLCEKRYAFWLNISYFCQNVTCNGGIFIFYSYATGAPFPPNFQDVVKTIFKRLFRVYAHIYHSHFQKIVSLKEEAHLNTCFKHFVLFTWVSYLILWFVNYIQV